MIADITDLWAGAATASRRLRDRPAVAAVAVGRAGDRDVIVL